MGWAMEFNRFLWDNYKESASGKKLYTFFKNYNEIIIKSKEFNDYQQIRQNVAYKGTFNIDFSNYVKEISDVYFALNTDENGIFTKITVDSINGAEKFFNDIIEFTYQDDDGNIVGSVFSSSDIPFLSEVLFAIAPQYYFPYYFCRIYQDLVEIFNTFGIFLPSVPKKNDERSRFLHYFELCRSLYQFRIKNNLDEYDLPLFLYGFAINVIKRYKITDDLPEPRKAYFVGAGKKDSTVDSSKDFNFLDNLSHESISNWNGNPDTQTGDIIVMYCLTPRSYIHSIGRAVTLGSIDPFFHYYKNINIGQPIIVKNISLSELKKDPVFKDFSLVKANMQGINGRNIPKEYYDHLLELLEKKGQDISRLPKLENNNIKLLELTNERDVEVHLLEPLLIKIGYKENDWIRQMKLRMGRGDRVYPDYVIFPNDERNNESGYWVWEAKYTISSHRQLEEDFGQAKSYALRLRSKGLGLISKEGVWLSIPDYDIKKIKFWSWKQINEHAYINEIFDIAGNKKTV